MQSLVMDEINNLDPVYFPHRVNVDQHLFMPISMVATKFDCMSGYFSSGVLRELAHAISVYLQSSGSNKMRFIVGPNFSSNEDINAFHRAVELEEDLIPHIFGEVDFSIENLKTKTIKMMSYLIAKGRLELKIAIMSSGEGIFHQKFWLFETDKGNVVIHGSGNATGSGLSVNSEQFNLTRAWLSENDKVAFDKLRREFDLVWSEKDDIVLCAPLNKETIQHIKSIKTGIDSKESAYQDLNQYFRKIITDSGSNEERFPKIPDQINGKKFEIMSHQKKAISDWRANEFKGILQLATGSGKTITSIYAATKLYEARKTKGAATILIIAVPYIELAKQWVSNLEVFNIKPIKCWDSRNSWLDILKKEATSFSMKSTDFMSIVVVNRTLTSGSFQNILNKFNQKDIFFIGDECHRHGSEKLSGTLPTAFYRMGLSATPFNSDDDEFDSPFPDHAKERLKSYYGEIVSSYTLADAINDEVLCEYEYHIVPVYLTVEEQESFEEISAEIGRLIAIQKEGVLSEGQKQKLTIECGKRSRLLGSAEDKLNALKKLLTNFPPTDRKHSLFYCGEGVVENSSTENSELEIKNINRVSRALMNSGWSSSRFTSQENTVIRKKIMNEFVEGSIDALVSLKVLDEGVDVPVCNKAFILASTRNPRQYVQRRGRVLRKSAGKDRAHIYDFVVLPSLGARSSASLGLISAELERVDDFCMLARNKYEVELEIDRLEMRNE